MTNQFFVGQQVQCIDDSTLPEQYLEVRKGEIYTIRWIGIAKGYMNGEYLGVRLSGIRRGDCPQFGEQDPPFRATRFRPLINDRLGSLRALLVPGQPLAPAPEEPRRQADVKEKEDV
ncbi:hypothetical protein DEM27_08315 [Metarhizobium album]|uniref:CAP-Gly domain protein n=1 Tax=Metarhizobium album TaxID=2182425 RepID=A0A2U2DSY0_9HYPH|nr:hypothetical protein [Rhizobium album]PWE56392.1 hypothetical protein DEM27_08315 [Rhizobium album]